MYLTCDQSKIFNDFISSITELLNKLALHKLNHTQISIPILLKTFNYMHISKQFNITRKVAGNSWSTHFQIFNKKLSI